MPTITEAINQLKLYQAIDEIDSVLTRLNTLVTENPEITQGNMVEDLRKQLTSIVAANEKLPLADAAYTALLALAELKPISDQDFYTQETIPTENSIFTSTGHQFDIQSLISYHNTRQHRDSALGETSTKKWLLNPITNLKFSPRDAEHIQAVAKAKSISVNSLKTAGDVQVNSPQDNAPQVLPSSNTSFFSPQQQQQREIEFLARFNRSSYITTRVDYKSMSSCKAIPNSSKQRISNRAPAVQEDSVETPTSSGPK